MKRLLSIGSGSIYQICKAFRNEPKEKIHNYEFTIIEWYRVGLDHHDLIKEIVILIKELKSSASILYYSYQEIFIKILGIDPHTVNFTELYKLVIHYVGKIKNFNLDNNDCLNLLFTHLY